ncbi:MAG TPA: DUF2975 domain-containing protein [Caulobacteraceae bacterium]|jgi:hypothetical protein|nr:DUF2975 domain-containing protein [Caulobacteraceae bacterium]
MIRALGPGSVSSFLKVILDVFYVVLWPVGLLIAAIILALLLISFNPQVLPAAVLAHAQIMGHAPGLPAAVRLTGAELSLIGVLVIVQRLRKVFGAMTAGDPFHPDNVRRLRVIALVLALIEINDYAFAALDRFVLGAHAPASFSLNLTAWFAVLVIVVLAEVFREGARLRRDAELTI